MISIANSVACVAALAHLGVAVLAWRRGRARAMGRSLAGMAGSFAVWLLADVAADFAWHEALEILDEAAVALGAAFGVDYVLSFVGERKRRRPWILATYTYFVALSCVTGLGIFFSGLAGFASSKLWSWLLLLGIFVFGGFAAFFVIRYALHAAAREERVRTRTVLLAVLIGMTLAPADALRTLSTTLESELPRLSDLGTLFTTVLFYVVMTRITFNGVELATSRAFQALVVMGSVALVALFGIVALQDVMAWSAVSITSTLVLMLLTYQWVQFRTEQRERTRNLATLGRLSSQLAHDLRNPIAAIKHAAEFIEGERDARRIQLSEEVAKHMVLIHQQADRMNDLVERYRLFSEQDIHRTKVDIAGLVDRCLASAKGLIPGSVSIEHRTGVDLPRLAVDVDLFGAALDNLIRNAIEAMPAGGTLTVEEAARSDGGVSLVVADTGCGMSPRDSEQVFDEFFTTKARGSGLGLAFVRRIVENHGGRVGLDSTLGEGTRVTIIFPGEAQRD